MGPGEASIVGGVVVIAVVLSRVVEALVTSKLANGKGKKSEPPPSTRGEECLDLVRQTHFVVSQASKSAEKQTELLGEIRDGVRDLCRDSQRAETGRFPAVARSAGAR